MKFTWFHLMPWPHMPDDFRREAPFGVGRPAQPDVRAGAGPRHLSPVSRPARIRRAGGLRRHRRERAPRQRLWPDAVAQPHGGDPDAAHLEGGAGRARQFDRALQSADPRGRGIRHARRAVGRAAGRGLPGRHLDGHQLRLRHDPGADAREIRRGARSDPQGLGGRRAVRLQRPLHQAALRQLLAQADPASRRRRSSFPAAARSRPTTSASTTPIPIPISATRATCAPSS